MPMHVVVHVICEKCDRRGTATLHLRRELSDDYTPLSKLKMDVEEIDLDPGWTMGRLDVRCPDHRPNGWN